METPSTDTPATMALAGLDDDHPAITRFDPDVSAELYTTNGNVTDVHGDHDRDRDLHGRRRDAQRE